MQLLYVFALLLITPPAFAGVSPVSASAMGIFGLPGLLGSGAVMTLLAIRFMRANNKDED